MQKILFCNLPVGTGFKTVRYKIIKKIQDNFDEMKINNNIVGTVIQTVSQLYSNAIGFEVKIEN
ncbi:MAG: hypothetical protein DRP78_05970 [Candidatus Omnitrophota bacterium]|nr:MAG: hypothetical protein DRP78_05970 [Candidatus Omnitrophota bacterium]